MTVFLCAPVASAQQLRVIPDGSTGTTISVGSADCSADCTITGTSAVGGNLFHSFSEFSIPADVVVTFDDGGLDNIFTRVSDATQSSSILGNLSVSGAANFFLINPAGITFGQEASLNLNGGSFVASTAERLTFEDGTQFAVTDAMAPVALTISTPIGLQFSSTVGPIVNQSQSSALPSGMPITNTLGAPAGLRVNTFETLALLGGNLTSAGGNLTALGGNVELGSVSPNSEVSIDTTTQGFDFVYGSIPTTQNIQLLGSLIDVGGPGGGQIHLQGNEVTLESSGIFGATFGPLGGGVIGVDATTLALSNSTVQGITFSSAQGASINFNVDTLSLNSGSVVSAETQGSGNSGNVSVQGLNSQPLNLLAADTITLNQSFLGSEVAAGAVGQGGQVSLNAAILSLQDSGILSNTFGTGNGGDLAVTATESATLRGDAQISTTADDSFISSSTPQVAVGDAGSIALTGGDLDVLDGSQVQATTFGNAGNGGDVTIRANAVTFAGQTANGRSSGVFSQVEPGQVTGNLPQGQGGRIAIEAETLRLLESGTVSASAFEGGTAGDIVIVSSGQVEIVGGDNGSSGVFAIGQGNGQSGNIELSAQRLRLASRGQISAATQTDVGGNVDLQLAESAVLRSVSLISARAKEGGSGGNVTIETGFLIGDAVSDGDIVASAINGAGGNIQISADGILGFAEGPSSLTNGTNDIDASSQFGADGVVTVENPDTDPSKGLVPLPENLADLANQVAQSCGSANQLAANQFMVTGRGGLLPTPEVSLRARQLFADVGPVEPPKATSPVIANASLASHLLEATDIETPLVEAQGWAVNRDGNIALIHSTTTSSNSTALGHLYASSCQGVSS